jgi:hypothetical protein
MAKRTVLSELSVNTEANAFAALMDGGFIDFYDGAPPKDADTPVKGQTLGVTLGFGSPAFGPAVAGVITANPITPGVAVARLESGDVGACLSGRSSDGGHGCVGGG